MEKQIKENPFDLYQVVAKCSDGDVLIGKDGKDVFNLNEAKAIQSEHQGLGAEVVLKPLDRKKTKEIIIKLLLKHYCCPFYWNEYNLEVEITDTSIEIIADECFHWMVETYDNGDSYHSCTSIYNCCMSYADLVFSQCVFDILEELFDIEISNK